MHQFPAYAVFKGMEMLRVFNAAFQQDSAEPLTDLRASFLTKTVEPLRDICARLGLSGPLSEIDHLLQQLRLRSAGSLPTHRVFGMVGAICRRLDDALLDGVYFYAPVAHGRWHASVRPECKALEENLPPRWHPEAVPEALRLQFPTAAVEIQAGRDCYATGNYTACVFHLMRAAEYGLRALAVAAGVPPNPMRPIEYETWGAIIGKVRDAVNGVPATRWKAPARAEYLAFFNGALADFDALKDTCRNKLMHAQSGFYGEQEAHYWAARVTDCLLRLAARCSEGAAITLLAEVDFT